MILLNQAIKYQILRNKYGTAPGYATKNATSPAIASRIPSLYFYYRLVTGPVQWLFRKAAAGECDDSAWVHGSAWTGDTLENCGGKILIDGLNVIKKTPLPCVFIANHMSTLETFLLPAILRPYTPVTFVVKKSLVKMPLFGPVMRSRDPVVVCRDNPREDLATVLSGGCERLAKGISIVVFPQSTRSLDFNEDHFNTIGIKLARKANRPVIPLALKTDAWGHGKHIKEAGRIRPDLPARFKFGQPLFIEGNGKAEHRKICDFIRENLCRWQEQDGVNR